MNISKISFDSCSLISRSFPANFSCYFSFFSFSFFFSHPYNMSQGLSHIVLRATTPEDFERTKQFYTAFGFEQILDQEDRTAVSTSERRVWLKLSAAANSLTSELTIKLALSPSAMRQEQLPDEIDWALKEYSVVLNTDDLTVSWTGCVAWFISGEWLKHNTTRLSIEHQNQAWNHWCSLSNKGQQDLRTRPFAQCRCLQWQACHSEFIGSRTLAQWRQCPRFRKAGVTSSETFSQDWCLDFRWWRSWYECSCTCCCSLWYHQRMRSLCYLWRLSRYAFPFSIGCHYIYLLMCVLRFGGWWQVYSQDGLEECAWFLGRGKFAWYQWMMKMAWYSY